MLSVFTTKNNTNKGMEETLVSDRYVYGLGGGGDDGFMGV